MMRKYWLLGSGYPQGRPEVWLALQKLVKSLFLPCGHPRSEIVRNGNGLGAAVYCGMCGTNVEE